MKRHIILFLIAFSMIGCENSKKSLKIGESGTTRQTCLSAISLDSFDEMTQASVRNDEPKVKEMVTYGLVYIIPERTYGAIREIKFGKYLFECDINGSIKRLWVSSDFIE